MNIQDKSGIWKYKDRLPKIDTSCMLSLGEGNTPYKIIDGIGFKCEYENPTGSVKDRGIVYQIAKAKEEGYTQAVISSSGNAAISASQYAKLFGIKLTVFVSEKINKSKLEILRKSNSRIIVSPKPVSKAFVFAKENNAYNLRQSTDENAPYGYETIAYELIDIEPEIDAIILPVSSGTTMVGIYEGFRGLSHIPSFHLVQTEAIHPIASKFDKDFVPKVESLADAIVAKFTKREDVLLEIIRKSGGSGWVAEEEKLGENIKWLHSHGLICSYEGAIVLSAYQKVKEKGFHYNHPVCLLTGKYYLN